MGKFTYKGHQVEVNKIYPEYYEITFWIKGEDANSQSVDAVDMKDAHEIAKNLVEHKINKES